jgi:hypothetical protein
VDALGADRSDAADGVAHLGLFDAQRVRLLDQAAAERRAVPLIRDLPLTI